MKTASKKKKAVIIVMIVLLVLNIADCVLTIAIYKENFDRRFTTDDMYSRAEDYKDLIAQRYEFESDKGQKLTGYMYSFPYSSQLPKGIVILAHGFGGGGHRSYLSIIDRFARHSGYYVFAYDATGNDESEGSGVGGLPQGVIDLDHAISFVENNADFPKLPIVLFGHSWGGYSVMNVLRYHPEVKAAAECSGFLNASDLYEIVGKKQAGAGIYAMLPYVKLYDLIKFGKYAANNAFDAFEASDTPVMVIHSTDDPVVPIEYGYDKIYERYGRDPRFEFVPFMLSGHNSYEDNDKLEALQKGFDEWVSFRGYDPEAPENKERRDADKKYYIENVIGRTKLTDTLNDSLFMSIAEFYDRNIEKE